MRFYNIYILFVRIAEMKNMSYELQRDITDSEAVRQSAPDINEDYHLHTVLIQWNLPVKFSPLRSSLRFHTQEKEDPGL